MSIPTAIEDLIADARLSAHLATSVDDRPHVAPVWYVYDDGQLSILTGGKKLRNVRENSRVALSIERYDEDGVAWSVHFLGTATIVDDEDQIDAISRRMDEKYEGEYGTDGGEIEGEWGLIQIAIGSATWYEY